MKKFLVRFNLILWLLVTLLNSADAAKLSTYTSATSLNNADYWPIVQSGTNKNINWENTQQLLGVDTSIIYNVKQYGAKGDGLTLFDGTITSGTPNFTSATAVFTSADVGKVITITGAGGTNTDLTTTISAFVSATAVTLSANASATVSGVPYTYGTDDTSAINSIITTISAQTKPQGEIYFPSGTYIVNGAFNKANNSQIGLPTISSTDTTPRNHTIIKMRGSIYGKSTNTQRYATGGSVIYSTRQGVAGDSIISGKAVGSSGSLTDVRFELDTLTFRTVQNPVNSALNLEFVNSAFGRNLYIEAGTVLLDSAQPTTSTSTGLITPGVLNNSISYWNNIRVQGFYNGIKAQEHAQFANTFILLTVNGFVITSTGHTVYAQYLGVERTINNVVCSTASSIVINDLDVEHNGSGLWYDTLFDLKDPSNLCIGRVSYWIQGTGGGGTTLLTSGAGNIDTFDLRSTARIWKQSATGVNFFENTGTANGTSSGATVSVSQNNATAVTSGTRLGTFSFVGAYNASNNRIFGAQIGARSEETFTSTAGGSYMYFATTPIGASSPVERMRLTNGGNLGIGSTNPGATLDVTGTIRASSGTAGQATCWKADKTLGQCTSVVGAGGDCTCS